MNLQHGNDIARTERDSDAAGAQDACVAQRRPQTRRQNRNLHRSQRDIYPPTAFLRTPPHHRQSEEGDHVQGAKEHDARYCSWSCQRSEAYKLH